MNEECKLRVGNERKLGTLIHRDDRIYFNFGYWPALNSEIKLMEGRKYHGYDPEPLKQWSIPVTHRNLFALDYLKEKNPYARFEAPFVQYASRRTETREHQYKLLTPQWLTTHASIWAVEMGAGKSLAALEGVEHIDPKIKMSDFYWMAPRSALMSVELEFEKWKSSIRPTFLTYEGLNKEVKNWPKGKKPPRIAVFDESSYLKTVNAQRSLFAKHLADAMRTEWGNDAYILLMTGTPAPKSPKDWWMQCEIACPGFLQEGDVFKFERRLAIIDERENPVTGGKYPHLVAWRDDIHRCDKCGKMDVDVIHAEPQNDFEIFQNKDWHPFVASKNEVAHLYERMKGLVVVLFKKDIMALPDKQYTIFNVEPSKSTLRAAKLITQTQPTAIRIMTLLRELSDGFQYAETQTGIKPCEFCSGTGKSINFVDSSGYPVTSETANMDVSKCECGWEGFNELACPNCGEQCHIVSKSDVREVEGPCSVCDGKCTVPIIERNTKEVVSPKDEIFKNLLDQHEEIGRFVTYGGFTATIDRLVRMALEMQWAVIRVDGRGWHTFAPGGGPIEGKPLDIFQNQKEKYPKVIFIAHPKSASTGLTLTASPGILYYSNDFNAQDRMQSEDRIHRISMDVNRGATIYDIFHLPTDKVVLDNLKKKRELQSMTLGEIQNVFNEK